MDSDSSDETANARSDLASWLDDYTAGRCDRARMQASFLEICRSNREAPWDALALLDQYQRRGRVDALLARSLKGDIAQLVFGVVNQSEEDEESDEDEDDDEVRQPRKEVTADASGTRWRQPIGNHETQPVRADEDDSVLVSRDLGPPSQPLVAKPRSLRTQEVVVPGGVLRDRYELLKVLGRGHSGTVYKALDRHRANLDVSARCIALRVLKLNPGDRQYALADLERQFHQAQSLSHPNIVSVFDLDRDGSTYFLVMELLEGELLSDVLVRLEGRPMVRDHALAIVGGIGAALAYAHRRGVVHSDLKPANVMLAANADVKVLDFGFSKRQPSDSKRMEPWIGEATDSESPRSGTLAYSSEELVNAERPDESDDVYSLGCIAYELLAGQHPFAGRSAPLARAHGRPPQRIDRLSRSQWAALQTALQWSRGNRKITVDELIEGLGCAAVPRHLTPPQQIGADGGSSVPGVIGKATVIALLLAGAAALYWLSPWPMPKFMARPLSVTVEQIPGSEHENVQQTVPPAAIAVDEPEPVATQPDSRARTCRHVRRRSRLLFPSNPRRKVMRFRLPRLLRQWHLPGSPLRFRPVSPSTRIRMSQPRVMEWQRSPSGVRAACAIPSVSSGRCCPDSAVGGDDFAAIGPGTEEIAAGSGSVTLTIPLVSDAIREPTELFLVELSAVENSAGLGELTRAAVVIVDDDETVPGE